MTDSLEIYEKTSLLVRVKTSFVPAVGSAISIRGCTYTVVALSYAVDYADTPERCMCANIRVERLKKQGEQ